MKRQEYDTNRSLAQKPRSRHSWCFGCDCNLVDGGGRCKTCKKREVHRHRMKTKKGHLPP